MSENSELSLIELIREFIQNKITIIIITIISLFVGSVYAYYDKMLWKGTIEIDQINSSQFKKFEQLSIYSFLEIEEESIRNLFIEDLIDREEIVTILEDLKILKIEDFKSEDDYKFALKKNSFRVKIYQNETLNDVTQPWVIEYVTKDQNHIKKIFEYILEEVNTNTRDVIYKDLTNRVKLYQLENQFTIEDTKKKIEDLKDNYDKKINRQIVFLEEQAKIARSLNISSLIDSDFDYKFNEDVIFFENQETFKLGYEAIETKIDLILKRTDKSAFIVGLERYENQLRALERDMTPVRAQKLIDNSLGSQSFFKAVNYSIADIKISKTGTTDIAIILFSLITSFILSSIYVLIMYLRRKVL